jgi:hypothetical protein
MNEPEAQAPSAAPAGDMKPRADRVDLDNVNVMQQAILERVRRAQQRGQWLPRITPLQWLLSAIVAVILVAGIFNVVDAGLTAFQKFAEVAMRPDPEPAPEAVRPVDPSEPVAIMVVPDTSVVPDNGPAGPGSAPPPR